MKLGLVNKFDKRNKTTSKKFDDDAISSWRQNQPLKHKPHLKMNPYKSQPRLGLEQLG